MVIIWDPIVPSLGPFWLSDAGHAFHVRSVIPRPSLVRASGLSQLNGKTIGRLAVPLVRLL